MATAKLIFEDGRRVIVDFADAKGSAMVNGTLWSWDYRPMGGPDFYRGRLYRGPFVAYPPKAVWRAFNRWYRKQGRLKKLHRQMLRDSKPLSLTEGDKMTKPEPIDQEMIERMIRAIPPPEEIEKLLAGNCHHGKAVWLCEECEPGRLFEAMVVRLGGEFGCSDSEARAYAVQLMGEIRNPPCSHEGCNRLAEFTLRFKLRLRGAGSASGLYEGDIPGGLCGEHRDHFEARQSRGEVARDIAEGLCRDQGIDPPPRFATWKLRTTWKPIRKEVN